MQVKVPVDVHVAVGDDGQMMLVVGGLIRRISGDEFVAVMSSKPLANGRRREPAPKPAPTKAAGYVGGPHPKEGCRFCGKKRAPGKKVCPTHLAIALKSIKRARAAKQARRKKQALKTTIKAQGGKS